MKWSIVCLLFAASLIVFADAGNDLTVEEVKAFVQQLDDYFNKGGDAKKVYTSDAAILFPDNVLVVGTKEIHTEMAKRLHGKKVTFSNVTPFVEKKSGFVLFDIAIDLGEQVANLGIVTPIIKKGKKILGTGSVLRLQQ